MAEAILLDLEGDDAEMTDDDIESFDSTETDDQNGIDLSDNYMDELMNKLEVNEKRGRPTGYRKHNSKEENIQETKKVKRELIAINMLVAYLCCSALCLASLPIAVLEAARDGFQSLKTMERSQWILDWLTTHTRRPENKTVFLLNGVQVCQNAWLACLGIPKSTFYSVFSRFIDGAKQLVGPGNIAGKKTPETQYALSWLSTFSNRYADKMPDTNKLHLPCCLRKKDVYEMMVTEAEVYGEHVISMTHFLRVWARYLPHIVIPKRSRFTTCDTCAKIKVGIERASNRDERKKLFKIREIHLEQQNKERHKYYKHSQKAKAMPSRYLSVILDGMDQDKTSLPHSRENAKGLSNLWKLKVNLMGAIVHGYGAYGFFDTFQWAHGSSFTISVLVHTLLMLTSLPPVLYIQLDNCPGQNKNRYMLGFLAALVELGIFTKVKLSFLMVGHTHEDIDQLFSRFSTWLTCQEVRTLDSLLIGFEKCFTPSPIAIKTETVYNFGEYLEMNTIVNHSRPHVFKIIKEKGKATLYTKKWSTDKTWTKSEGDFLLRNCPSDHVNTIPPSIDRIEAKVISDIQTFSCFYRDNEMGRYWDSYFKTLKETEDNWEDENVPIMTMLAEKKKKEEDMDNIELPDICDNLEIPNVNDPIPPIKIGKKQHNSRQELEMKEGLFVLVDWAKYADEWPQVARIVKIVSPTEVEIHWYKGAKTTCWNPATKGNKGDGTGKSEPFVEKIHTSVIWYKGFTLTPSGNLPKHVKEAIDKYFD